MRRILFFFTYIIFAFQFFASASEYLVLVEKSDSLIEKENWIEAEKTILEALRKEPANFSNSLLLSNLGIVRNNQGHYQDALEAFSLGLSLQPSSTVLHNNRALTYLYIGDYDSAADDLNFSLDVDSIQEWPLQMKGLLLMKKGDVETAKKNFLDLLAHYPSNYVAYSSLGTISEIEGDKAKAMEYFNKALELNDDVETRSSRILLKIRNGEYSEAKKEINECINKSPEEPMFYILRGYLHKLNFRNEEAAADKKIAIAKGADLEIVDYYLP